MGWLSCPRVTLRAVVSRRVSSCLSPTLWWTNQFRTRLASENGRHFARKPVWLASGDVGCFLRTRRTSYSSQNNGSKTLETASNSKATLGKISCNVYDIFAGFIKDKEIKFLFDYLVFFKSIQSYAVPR